MRNVGCRQHLIALLLLLLMPGIVFWPPIETRAAESRKELLLGIEPEHNIFDQMERYRVLADYLSGKLGVKVRLTITSRYGELIKRFKSMHLDGAFLSSYTATVAMRELLLTPLANLDSKETGTTATGYIFSRKDNRMESVAKMRNKKIVFVDPATTEGYVFPLAYFRKHGVDNLDSYFSGQDFSGSHASSIYAVLDGRADIGASKNTVYLQLINKDPSIEKELQIIAESPPVPEITLCVKSDLDPDLLEKIQNVLISMDKTVDGRKVLKELGGTRFTSSDQKAFSVVLQMIKEAGLEMPGKAVVK